MTTRPVSQFNSRLRNLWAWFQTEGPQNVRIFSIDTLCLLVIACFWYFTYYLLNVATPANNPNGGQGWWGYWDQGQYYKTTIDLAEGHLRPSSYWFGYPSARNQLHRADLHRKTHPPPARHPASRTSALSSANFLPTTAPMWRASPALSSP